MPNGGRIQRPSPGRILYFAESWCPPKSGYFKPFYAKRRAFGIKMPAGRQIRRFLILEAPFCADRAAFGLLEKEKPVPGPDGQGNRQKGFDDSQGFCSAPFYFA
jgi:hypothetical protein